MFFLRELFWSHGFAEQFRYSIGWIDSTFRFDFNDVANDERYYFVADPLNNSLTIPFPDPGPAADLLWRAGEHIDLHVGLYASNCEKDSWCFDNLDSDEWFTPLELTLKNVFLGTGNYRLLMYYTETDNKRGGGWSISFDQRFGRFTPFVRAGRDTSEAADFRRFFSLGIGMDGPAMRPWDQAGIGFSRGAPTDRVLRDESLVEVYWRFQLSPFVALSPHLQWVLNPAKNPEEGRIIIGGVRLQLDF